jgi:hypothetical protein
MERAAIGSPFSFLFLLRVLCGPLLHFLRSQICKPLKTTVHSWATSGIK